MTRADTIARHLSVFETHLRTVARGVDVETRTSAVPDAVAALREAFAALDGGAAVAGEANGPPEPAPPDEEPSAEVLAADDSPDEPSGLWVVKTPTGWFRGAGLSDARVLARARRFPQRRDAVACAIDTVGVVLTLAEAEQAEPPKPYKASRDADGFGKCEFCGCTTNAHLRRCCDAGYNADRGGELKPPTPEPPKPAGWVVRDDELNDPRPFNGRLGWHATVAEAGPFETRTEAEAVAKRAVHVHVVPVDAAGNVIEALPGVAWEAARAGEEAERLRTELAAVKAERDALNAAEADLRHALRQIAELVGGAVSLGASTDMHCAVANEVRVVVADLRAERDALAAEVRRSREQKPVHLALVDKQGAVVDGYLIKTRALAEDDARRRACTVAPLYLAPVVRDHSGVIAQCEEALREWDSKGAHCSATSSMVAVTLTKARNALRGAS